MCPGTRLAAEPREQQLFSAIELMAPTPHTAIPCDDSCQRWQVAQWLSILLVVIVFYTVYYIAFMDLKRDSLLYSKFGSNPAQRKAQ